MVKRRSFDPCCRMEAGEDSQPEGGCKRDMRKGYYGKEPFDLRLTVLRMLYKLPVVIAVTLLGSLLFGGGYYVKNVLLRGESLYSVTSRYRVEYAVDEEKDVGTVYINEVSWNTYLQTDLVLDGVRKHMTDMSENAGEETGNPVDESLLREAMEAVLASDLRVLATVVTTDNPEKSLRIAKALEKALTEEFAEEIREIVSIEVIDAGSSAVEVIPDVRVGRAFILSGVLSCFFVILLLLLQETGDDSIWLPSSLWKRYGLKTVGTPESRELEENLRYFFRQTEGQGVVCVAEEGMDSEEILNQLKEKCPGGAAEGLKAVQGCLPGGDLCPVLREAGGILLVVKAGRHAGRHLEHVLEYLEQQDCQVTAALLWGADLRLLRRYYWKGFF